MARRKPVFVVSAALLVVVAVLFGPSILDNLGLGTGDPPAEGTDPVTEPAAEEIVRDGADETEPPEEQPAPTRPLRIVIRDREYFIASQKATLAQTLATAARVPAGSGPTVVVERSESSRASAEERLARTLEEKGIDFEWAE